MQEVLFSWLVIGVLQAQAKWVGIAQSATLLPSEVAGPNLLRAVSGLALTQGGTQALGALIAGAVQRRAALRNLG